MKQPVVLFDGVCNFCNGTVNYLIRRDKKKRLKFAALQTETGQEMLRKFNLKAKDLDTIILIEDERYYEKSTAVLRIGKIVGGIWKMLYVFVVIPRAMRDFFYNLIAKNRYKWFGRREKCMVPSAEMKQRFLE